MNKALLLAAGVLALIGLVMYALVLWGGQSVYWPFVPVFWALAAGLVSVMVSRNPIAAIVVFAAVGIAFEVLLKFSVIPGG